jgi:L-ascorbate metabolism protein UlaG (beta-lactamase superfamily)
MDWWQERDLPGGLRLTCVPAEHSSGRGLRDREATLWCGYAIHGSGGMIYFAGDTGFGSHFRAIVRRLGTPRLAILPIGAWLPGWFMGPVHMSPEEAVQAHQGLGARMSMAIHFGTFHLADDGEHEAVNELEAALALAGLTKNDFWVPGFGEGREIP